MFHRLVYLLDEFKNVEKIQLFMFLNKLFPSSSWYLLCLSMHAAYNMVSYYQCFLISRNHSPSCDILFNNTAAHSIKPSLTF